VLVAALLLGATLLAASHAAAHERGAPHACTVCQWARATPAAVHAASELPPPRGFASPLVARSGSAGRVVPARIACRGPPARAAAVP
jgi:hypothetical protein